MAGFIFSISSKEGIGGVKQRVLEGNYAALVPADLRTLKARQVISSVLADYCSMKSGDNVYFLSNRCLYGVGRLVNIAGDCKYKNYISAHKLQTIHELTEEDKPLKCNNPCARWICFFEPDREFFEKGVDMDEVLTYRPSSFRMLRAFQDRSFIKIDDEENRALKEFIYLKNRNNDEIMVYSEEDHRRISSFNLNEYKILPNATIAENYNIESGEVGFEMLLEAALVDKIQREKFLGVQYDYVTHQVIASPFKPLVYIDKIDILAYRYLETYPDIQKPIEKYLIIELKKGKANRETLAQTMRYVDWVCKEYAAGNYSLVKAVVIAKNYVKELRKNIDTELVRNFISSTHPIETNVWSDIQLLTYQIEASGDILLNEYDSFDAGKFLWEQLEELGMNVSKAEIRVNGNVCAPIFKVLNKKLAFYNHKVEDNEKVLLESRGWKIYTIYELRNKEMVKELIKQIIN